MDENKIDDEPKEKKLKEEEEIATISVDEESSQTDEDPPVYIQNKRVRRSRRIRKRLEAKVLAENQMNGLLCRTPIPGDLVLGEIIEKRNNLWIIDVQVDRRAQLIVDVNCMPSYYLKPNDYKVADLIACCVSSIDNNKVSLHMTGEWCGKVNDAILLHVNPEKIAYPNTEIIDMSCGIKIVLTLNGYIWIGPADMKLINYSRCKTVSKMLNADLMKKLKKLRAAIVALVNMDILIFKDSLEIAFAECAKYTIAELRIKRVLNTIGVRVHNQLIMSKLLQDDN